MDGYRKLYIYDKILKYLVCFVAVVMVTVPLYKSYKYSVAAKKFIISEEAINLGMLYPKYQAVTNSNKLFNINAKKSLNQSENSILFYKINGNLEDDYYEKINFIADQGLYNKDVSTIDFTKGVNFFSKENFRLSSDKALYLMKTNSISGSDNIIFDNYMGKFVAQEYDIDLLKQKYVFLKDIHFQANDVRHTYIESQKITVYDFANNMEVEEDVKYKDDSIVLTSERFTVFYKKNASNQVIINKVIAYNDVRILHENSVITGEKAIFYPNQDMVEIMQNVVLVQQENIVKGEKMIYDITQDSFRVLQGKDNKVNLQLKHE